VFAKSRRHSGPQIEQALLKTTDSHAVKDVDGHRLAYVRSLDTDGHTFVLAQYLDRVEAALHYQLLRRAVLLILMALTIVLFIYLAVACWVIGPLEELAHAAKQWTARDFSARAPSSGPSDFRVVAREFNSMAEELEAHEQRRHQELDEAREIQANLLPKLPLEVSGLKLTAEYRPATHVAGDLYDVFALADGRIALAVLDVSGHGISAAMLTGVAKISLRRCLAEYSNLSKAMRHVNSDIVTCTSDSYFVTACVGIWNPHDRRWTYCAAGHPGGVLIRKGKARELPSTAPLLGILPDGQWDAKSLILSPEDRVFLYTDGIVEAEIGDKQFGTDGLNAVLQRTSHLNLPEQAKAVIQAVSRPNGEHPSDDATIFAFEFHTPTPVKASVTA
jgi:HAMP domain-containing protein